MENSVKKIIFLDNDGVICLITEWGSRYKKTKPYSNPNPNIRDVPVEFRFDNFNQKAVKVLNEILEETGAEIVVSSDWRFHATLEELGEYYLSQGIIKKPIGVTTNSLEENSYQFCRNYEIEQTRSYEILEWLKDHPEVTHWVAVDDLNMSERIGEISGNYQWGLKNFVHTPRSNEGIKQTGIKEKILKFLI